MKLLSFDIIGTFGAFRDPSVTSNQTVYFIPSKSAVIGILGAMIGVPRGHSLGPIYSQQYLNLFSKTKIGIEMKSEPKKVTIFTNHRSLKEAKTKPFKTEMIDSPSYRFHVLTEEPYLTKLESAISSHNFVYTPYLGHAYCPATISELKIQETKETKSKSKETSCVILDESETFNESFEFRIGPAIDNENSRVIIERHMHHYIKDNELKRIILKHWIPVAGSRYVIDRDDKRDLSMFVEAQNQIICMY